VLLVIFSHIFFMRDVMGIERDTSTLYLQEFGAIGVDIFFVISGFIITYTASQWKGSNAAADFAKRRFIRIAPAYYIASGFYLLRLVLTAVSQSIPGSNRIIDALTLLKTVTILPIFDKGHFQAPILNIGWTLSFEFLFYLIFTLLILLRVNRRDLYLLGIIIVLGVTGIIFPIQQVQLKFITNPVILEFAFGVFICILYQRLKNISFGLSIGILIAALFMFVCLIKFGFEDIGGIKSTTDGNLAPQRVLYWGIPSALLVGSLLFIEKCRPHLMKENKFLLFIGEASYSLYLVHQYAFMGLVRVANRFHLQQMNIILFIIISMVMALICGALFHVFVEKPLIKKLNKVFIKRRETQILPSL
jgi:exopolysaccharide production protein ExoZ